MAKLKTKDIAGAVLEDLRDARENREAPKELTEKLIKEVLELGLNYLAREVSVSDVVKELEDRSE